MRCPSWSAHCSRLFVLNEWLSRTVRYLAPLAPLAVALLPVLAYRNDTYRPSLVIVAGTGLTLVTLIGVVTRPRSVLGSLLASGPMRWLGERSYSIYLWNVLARIAILHALGHTRVGDVAWIAMFVVLAEASFRFVERPLRAKFARRSAMPGPPQVGPGTRETERRWGPGTTSIKRRFMVTLRSHRPGG